MNNSLSPTYKRMFGDFCVLWYQSSNTYSIVDYSFNTILELYLQSENIEDFASYLQSENLDIKSIIETINNYLKSCNTVSFSASKTSIDFNNTKRNFKRFYKINKLMIQINYDSELVLKTIHPSLSHLEIKETNDIPNTVFDFFLQDGELHLFKNKKWVISSPKRAYHIIQGKFAIQLLCSIYDLEEADWIGTFHGSTITDNDSSVLFVGESGKGKSTLCALLCASGFNLVADDVSPLRSQDKCIYVNPSALSIKEGSFEVLKTIVPNFDDVPITEFNKSKGKIKYLAFTPPQEDRYPCKAIVSVNYTKGSDTILEKTSIKEVLEIIIPESWISHNTVHAKQFLHWLENVEFYKLHYSDNQSVIKEISSLFKSLK
ncbi:hypothetical protein [Winogradskyella sp. SYSU M77433]|uniref:hypothetical protein n=1 Tax=Winogradskyella sp. SYSU M77433 TaxID=3042722 RepID=UPI00247FAB3E|nr:hypothetical protein [Winogradskyella sp. SYSU M77433]MDH7911536.1 hypothetical protein [Winogradskyella sp. SYSU M77433]